MIGDWYESQSGEMLVEGGDLLDRCAEAYVNGDIDVDRFLARIESVSTRFGVVLINQRLCP